MTTVRRLTDSCLLVTNDSDATLFDPGFHTFSGKDIDLGSIGDVSRVFITHEHGDHMNPEFIKWLIDRSSDLVVFSNSAVEGLLAEHDIRVSTEVPPASSVEDVIHETLPNGTAPPNRAFTIDDVLTHPGDSRQVTSSAPVLALPLLVPWDSMTSGVAFAKRLAPRQVIPVHDWYLTEAGREFLTHFAGPPLTKAGIEYVPLGWGDSFTL